MHKFCPSCGKSITRGRLCPHCKEAPDVKYRDVVIIVSPHTKKYLLSNKWKPYTNIDEAITETVLARLKTKETARVKKVACDKDYAAIKENQMLNLIVTVTVDKHFLDIPAVLQAQPSPGIRQGTYFEGILQLRHTTPAIVEKAKRIIEQKGGHIAKEAEQKDGVDLFMSPKNTIDVVAKYLVQEFGGTLSKNAQLFSRNKQTSKDIFRINMLVLFPQFTKGTVIKHNNTLYEVVHFGKQLKVRSLLHNKETSIKFSNGITALPVQETTITKVHPRLEVLHPETYQSEPVKNTPKRTCGLDDPVRIVDDNGLWIV